MSTLDILADVADILAGLAIIVSFIRLWPVIGNWRQLRDRRPRKRQHLAPIEAGLNQLDDFSCPKLKRINDARDAMLSAVVKTGASDLHISNEWVDGEDQGTLRFRRNGERMRIAVFPAYLVTLLVQSFEALAADGDASVERIKFDAAGELYDARVNIHQTMQGPRLNLRVLDLSSAKMPIEALSIPPRVSDRIASVVDSSHRQGLLVFSGPTGCGKSVTIYSYLRLLMAQNVEVASIEDPVEIDVPGLSQMQVLDADGFRFSDRVRTVARSDVDVLMIGEIRDAETAAAALGFANEQGIVLTTMATEDAAAAVLKLHELDPAGLWRGGGHAHRLILNQRLYRALCKNCKQPHEPSDAEFALAERIAALNGETLDTQPRKFAKRVGCEKCDEGLRTRMPAYEALYASPAIEALCEQGDIASSRSLHANIREQAIQEGMRTISWGGLEQVCQGWIDFNEVQRLLAFGKA